MRPRIDQPTRRELAQRFANRRARHLEACRDVGLVECRSRRQYAAHDFIGQLQPQFFGARDLGRKRWRPTNAPNHRLRLGADALGSAGGQTVKTHVD
jgi:hypothetical protein